MYTKKKGLAVLIAAVTGLSSLAVGTVSAAPAAAENAEAVKILSLGDSITDGYWTSGAYRKYMYHDLEQMGYNIDMVGPKGGNSNTFTYNGQSVSYDDHFNSGSTGYDTSSGIFTCRCMGSGIFPGDGNLGCKGRTDPGSSGYPSPQTDRQTY